jgi:hypothetical protein
LVLISTHTATEVAKEDFYSPLGKVCDEVPNYYMKTILGDFDANFGNSHIYIQQVEGTTFTTKPMALENEW